MVFNSNSVALSCHSSCDPDPSPSHHHMGSNRNPSVEPLVQKRKISTNDERKAVKLSVFTSVQFINVTEDARFVAIDELDIVPEKVNKLNFQKSTVVSLRNPGGSVRAKREKTFDGSDIYNVMF